MKRNLSIFPLLLLMLFTGDPAVSADWNKGIAAYQTGDYTTALDKFFSLADQGHAHAQFNLGVMYRGGIGVPQNNDMAVMWYTLAAKQGLARAQSLLGSMYRGGKSVTQDDKIAIKWYTLAAEQGDADARYYLGVMYKRGVLQDYIYAYMWWDIAASSGDKMSAKNRDIIAEKMTLSQIKKAQNLVKQCVEKKYKGC